MLKACGPLPFQLSFCPRPPDSPEHTRSSIAKPFVPRWPESCFSHTVLCTTFGPRRVLAPRTLSSDHYRGRRLPCITPAAKQRRREKGALLAFPNQWHLFTVAPFSNYLCTISWLLDLSHEYLAHTHWAPRPALRSDSAVSRIQATSCKSFQALLATIQSISNPPLPYD